MAFSNEYLTEKEINLIKATELDSLLHSDVETILNVQDFVLKNFSFEIEPGAEG